ncbi:helix-turn-helix transcriptional regulator [Streptomyces sp. NPDC050535]|uniref:helix-turn-helix transcriptional regulator n=1 Tax=Streptomyces sp. NPDC050535 TaxID=3365626 RepID=UPI00378B3C57
MALEHAILVSLLEKPGSGYELARRFERSIGYFWTATHQRIYRVLKRMEHEDLLAVREVPQPGRPDKNENSVPDSARSRAADLLSQDEVFAFGLSEENHGADIYSTDILLEPDDAGGFRTSGSKYYIGNGNAAGLVSVFGRRTDVEGPDGYVFGDSGRDGGRARLAPTCRSTETGSFQRPTMKTRRGESRTRSSTNCLLCATGSRPRGAWP